MPDLRDIFTANVAKVEDDGRCATDLVMARLKRLTPGKFLREPPTVFAQLSLEQYYEIVATIAPEVTLPEPVVEMDDAPSLWERLTEYWHSRPPMTRALYASAFTAISLTFGIVTLAPRLDWALAPLSLRRDFDSKTWPDCYGLDESTDGCIYPTRNNLDWDWIARQAEIDVNMLHYVNPHLNRSFIPAGSKIVIWRGRGQLLGSGQ